MNEHYIDVIFSSANNLSPVDESWFEHTTESNLFGVPVSFIAPEELIWCKIYVQNRQRYESGRQKEVRDILNGEIFIYLTVIR